VSWSAIAILAVGSYSAKFVGLVVGPRLPLIRRLDGWLALLPAAMLAALVTAQTFDGGRRLVLDARAVGVGFGALAAWRRVPFVGVLIIAAAGTAIARAL
jgi:branched-subunit amino acid transport protein